MLKDSVTVARNAAEEFILKKFSIKWSFCKSRQKTKNTRCYNCHGFGYIVARYDGPSYRCNTEKWTTLQGVAKLFQNVKVNLRE